MHYDLKFFNLVMLVVLFSLASPLQLTKIRSFLKAIAQAQTTQDSGIRSPGEVVRPGARIGGGTRGGSCSQARPNPLTALLPETNLGQTTAAYPKFFWFMPKTTAQFVEFALYEVDKSENRTLIYRTTLNTTNKSGIISLSVPRHAGIPPLKIGEDYQWFVSIICDVNTRDMDEVVYGWVRRVASPVSIEHLEQISPYKRALLYMDNGIWFDALMTLAELRSARPQDPVVRATWSKLLSSVNLPNLADQPLIQSSTNSN